MKKKNGGNGVKSRVADALFMFSGTCLACVVVLFGVLVVKNQFNIPQAVYDIYYMGRQVGRFGANIFEEGFNIGVNVIEEQSKNPVVTKPEPIN